MAGALQQRAARPWPDKHMQLEKRLIQAVRKRRPLWDNSTPLHKNVRVLVHCWQQVAEELDMNHKAIKKKWKGLRDYFFRLLRELEQKSNGAKTNINETKYCLWPLFDQLKFLMANKKYNDFQGYAMSAEERETLEEVSEYERRHRGSLETIIYYEPSSPPEGLVPDNSSTPSQIVLLKNEHEQEITDPTKQCKASPLQIIKPTANTLQAIGFIQPETTNKELCEPPPLRVFNAPNKLKITDSQLTKIRPEQSQPPPFNKFKPTPRNNPESTKTTSNTEIDADLHFFKSLLPFMRALPLKDNLRVRTGIQDLILGELDSINTKDNLLAISSPMASDVDVDPLATQERFDNQESHPNRPVMVKKEFEDDQTLHQLILFEDSKNFVFDGDDNLL